MPHVRGLVVFVLLVAAVTGCRPSEPSPSEWRQKASQSLEDVASEVATAELVLQAQLDDRLLGRSGVVMLVEAEEATGSTVETFTALQPPERLQSRHDDVTKSLEHAADLLTEARSVRVREDEGAYAELVRTLADERATLTELAGQVR